jgi:predicted Zn-dependent protease
MQAAAFSAKDANLLFSACERLYRLKPEDPVAANNYAASLLILREQAPEAVRITLEVMNALPNAFSPVINHAVALCQVGRPADAGPLIKDADPDQYNPDDRVSLLFAKFQYLAGVGKYDDARSIERRLDRTLLFPPQIEWLNKTLAGFPK